MARRDRHLSRTALAGAAILYLAYRALARLRSANLDGQVALVTGGSRGLGLLIAEELLRQGCKVAICARDPDELEAARQRLARSGRVIALGCDLAKREEVEATVAQVLARFGRIDVLVNNGGVIQVGPLEAMSLADFELAMGVNFWGTVYTTLAVLPQMRARRSGRIANITSIGGKVAVPHLLPYTCSKFAALGFSEGIQEELAKDHIQVTTVIPGLMRTGSPMNVLFKGDRARELVWFAGGDATALTAMSAERAAKKIVRAIRRGRSHLTLGLQAKALRLTHDLLPRPTARLLSLGARLLPRSSDSASERGREIAAHADGHGVVQALARFIGRTARATNQFSGSRIAPSKRRRRRSHLPHARR